MNLAELMRWMANMPPIFSRPVQMRAVLGDLFESLTGTRTPIQIGALDKVPAQAQWTLAACHLLWHPSVRAQRYTDAQLQRVFFQEVALVAALIPIAQLAQDDERREELIRRTLRALGLSLEGESAEVSEDRLRQVDSAEHHRVLAEAHERERRATQVREAMAAKAAQEAAAKVSRE